MILRENAVEQFTFTCANCDRTWIIDYDVQHVEDGHGHQHDYFFRNKLPSVDPTASDRSSAQIAGPHMYGLGSPPYGSCPLFDAGVSAAPSIGAILLI